MHRAPSERHQTRLDYEEEHPSRQYGGMQVDQGEGDAALVKARK